jgi:hypothetical protein
VFLAESLVELGHEAGFFVAFPLARVHVRIHVMDHPVTGDRHVTGERSPIDHDDSILPEEAICAAVIDEARHEILVGDACSQIL